MMLNCWVLTEELRQIKLKIYFELNKLKTFDWSYFIGKSHFEEDDTQDYLVFQSISKYFKVIANTDYVTSWKSKGLSAETLNYLQHLIMVLLQQ